MATRVHIDALLPPKPWLALYQTDFAHLRAQTAKPNTEASSEESETPPSESDNSLHVLSLPAEVTRLIFSKLEAEQLSVVAQVCKAWLPFAYEPHQWRRICRKTWPHEAETCLERRLYRYKSWRKLATTRPRVRTNAIYVMRKQGARVSSQSAIYEPIAPVYLMTYYRLLRFYSDGTVAALTTPNSPHMVYRQVNRHGTKNVSVGEYHLEEETRTLHVQYPMVHTDYPNMVSGTIVMDFRLECTREGAFDRLFLMEHYVIGEGGSDVKRYMVNIGPFKMVGLWGFKSRVEYEFPRDDEKDLALWLEMKRASRRQK